MSTGYKKISCGNDLAFVDDLINEMLLILVEVASDDFWKILKYGSNDALINPTYTISTADKRAMVKQNNVDGDGKLITKVTVAKFNYDISADAHSEIRLFNASWGVPSLNNYELNLGVEIISHNKSLILDGVGKQTINVLRHEIYRIFNNSRVYKSIGLMTNVGTRGVIHLFNNDYQGYQLSLKTTSG
jgi:hypothetical protein